MCNSLLNEKLEAFLSEMKIVNGFVSIFFILKFIGSICARPAQIEISPQQIMVKSGDEVTVLCRAGEPTQYCRITRPSGSVLILAPTRPDRDGYMYAGDGLENGQCGFKISHVQEQNNGVHGCYMGLSDEASANMTIIVARPPSGLPDLTVGPDFTLQENDVLYARCTVHDSRPAANITWFFNGNQVSDADGLSSIAEDPPKCAEAGSLCSVSQNLTRSVTWKDNGKRLACVMNHFAMEVGSQNETIYQLNVQYKPHDDETSSEQLEFEIGKPGRIVKHVRANPRPTFMWNIGEGVWLNEGEASGRYKVDEALNNGQGAWFATLHIDPLTASDVEKVYELHVSNSVGSADYQVSISSMDTPAGVTLGAGAIVGIVAAILVILIIIFLIMFARTTGRWCFSRTTRNHVENDVTPLGTNTYEQMKKPKMNLYDVFMKKDKVADDSEELKGKTMIAGQLSPENKDAYDVVYAELDLQQVPQQPTMRRADDKTEYAEIIHTKKKDER